MNDLYRDILRSVMEDGQAVCPRGKETKELRPFAFTLTNSAQGLITMPKRNINHAFALVEALQMIALTSDANQQIRFNSNMANFVHGESLDFERPYGLAIREQVHHVIELLRKDPDSRQAVISIYDGMEAQAGRSHVPCTESLQFMVRNGTLELTVMMRSNDVWWGVPYDVTQFTAVQALIARGLGLPRGNYHHMVASMHIYEPMYEQAQDIVAYDTSPAALNFTFGPEEGPYTAVIKEARAILSLEEHASFTGYDDPAALEHLAMRYFSFTGYNNFCTLMDYQVRKLRKQE